MVKGEPLSLEEKSSEDRKEIIRDRDRRRMAKYRAQLTEEEREVIREKHRIKAAIRRANRTGEERELFLKNQREQMAKRRLSKADYRARLTEEEKDMIRERQRLKVANRRANLSWEEREDIRQRDRERKRQRFANLSGEALEDIRKINRERVSRYRDQLTEEEKDVISKRRKIKAKIRKDNTTGEDKEPCLKEKRTLNICNICGKTVTDLNSHMLGVHGSEEDKQYRCEICWKGFITQSKLDLHNVFHLNERPFKCKFGCGFASKTRGNLKTHENGKHARKWTYHDGVPSLDKKFQCSLCQSGFTQKSSLKMHEESVHYGVKHKCDTCGFQATQKTKLRAHIKINHEQQGEDKNLPAIEEDKQEVVKNDYDYNVIIPEMLQLEMKTTDVSPLQESELKIQNEYTMKVEEENTNEELETDYGENEDKMLLHEEFEEYSSASLEINDPTENEDKSFETLLEVDTPEVEETVEETLEEAGKTISENEDKSTLLEAVNTSENNSESIDEDNTNENDDTSARTTKQCKIEHTIADLLQNLVMSAEYTIGGAMEYNDVTFVCDDKKIYAHKLIISVCSPLLKSILTDVPNEHSFIYLPGVKYSDLKLLLDQIYFSGPAMQYADSEFLSLVETLGIQDMIDCGDSDSENPEQNEEILNDDCIMASLEHTESEEVELDYIEIVKSQKEDRLEVVETSEIQDMIDSNDNDDENAKQNEEIMNDDYAIVDSKHTESRKSDKSEFVQSDVENVKQNESLKISVKSESMSAICPECDKTFFDFNTMKRHQRRVHDGIKAHKCDKCGQCNECGQCKDMMRRHKKQAQNRKRTEKCNLCSFQIPNRAEAEIMKHKETVHNVIQRFACDKCPYITKWKKQLKCHIESIHEPVVFRFNCDQCIYKASHLRDLRKHIRRQHSASSCLCQLCGKTFGSPGSLENHKYVYHVRQQRTLHDTY